MRTLALNGTTTTWPKCLACALTDRAFGYTAANRTAECRDGFNTWCWDGMDKTSTPTIYESMVGTAPAFLVQNNLTISTGTANTSVTTSTSHSAGDKRAWSDENMWVVGVMEVGAMLGGGWVSV
jgi:lysophospholipase